jgi:glycosyltransferase involved in cell wall biosynthesis
MTGRSAEQGAKIDLSVVVPMYEEEETVAPLVERVLGVLAPLGQSFELILVDDGSGDRTADRIADQALAHPGVVRGVYLARNYGQSTAMQAGFDQARGTLVATLDGDLQNDPADIPAMLKVMAQEEADLVAGWRHRRQDDPIRKFFSRVANRLIGRLTGVQIHDYGCSLKIYRRELLERLRLYGELHRFIPALAAEVGGRVVEMKVDHHPRRFGRSKYSLDRTARVILDLLLIVFFRRYIQRPLHLFGGIGLILSGLGGCALTYLAGVKLLLGERIGDRPLLALAVLLVLLGVTLIGQGVMGELLIRTFFASGARPQYHTRLDHQLPVAARGHGTEEVESGKASGGSVSGGSM